MKVVKRIGRKVTDKYLDSRGFFLTGFGYRIFKNVIFRNEIQRRHAFSTDHIGGISFFLSGGKGRNCATRDRRENGCLTSEQGPPDRGIMAP